MRSSALLLLVCACTTLSTDDRSELANYQQQAALFYEGGRYGQALGQIERGLEIEPDDYKLNAIKGAILLLSSGDAQGTDHKLLDEATAILERVFDERSPSRHEPYLLLDYARALQKQGLRHLGESVRLVGQATRATADDAATLREQADEEKATATVLLEQADELLGHLIERGDYLRLAYNHRLQIARQLGKDDEFLVASAAYFEQAKKAQEVTKKRIEDTPSVEYENQELLSLRRLRDEELGVRSLVAEFHYGRKHYAEALEHQNRVLEIDPQRSVDYYNRGRILLELKRAEDAKSDFRRFLATTPLPATSDKSAFALQALAR